MYSLHAPASAADNLNVSEAAGADQPTAEAADESAPGLLTLLSATSIQSLESIDEAEFRPFTPWRPLSMPGGAHLHPHVHSHLSYGHEMGVPLFAHDAELSPTRAVKRRHARRYAVPHTD